MAGIALRRRARPQVVADAAAEAIVGPDEPTAPQEPLEERRERLLAQVEKRRGKIQAEEDRIAELNGEIAAVDWALKREAVSAELRKQADEHEARAAASKEERESLMTEAAGLEAKLAPIEGQLQKIPTRRAELEAELARLARDGGSLAEFVTAQAELASLDPAQVHYASAAAPTRDRLGVVRARLEQVQQAIDQAEWAAESLRDRAEHDPIGDGSQPDPETARLLAWQNDPRAKLAATLQQRANERADVAARRAMQGIVQGVDEKGRRYSALIDPTIG